MLSRVRKFTSGVAVAVVVVALTSCGSSAPPAAPAPVVPVVPVAAKTSAVTPTSTAHLDPESNAAAVKAMEPFANLSVETFDALPRDMRLRYAQYVMDVSTSNGIYEQVYKGANAVYVHPVVIGSIDNTGQEMTDRNWRTLQYAYMQFIAGELKPFDPIKGQKVLSLAYWDVGTGLLTNDYTDTRAQLQTLKHITPLGNKVTAEETSALEPYTDRDGNQVQSKVVTQVDADFKTLYVRYIYHEYTGYDGTTQKLWIEENISVSRADL